MPQATRRPLPSRPRRSPTCSQRRDVLGIAQTGTGKTAAFTLPMLTLLESGRARARMPRTLILEPTRELAAQVEDNFDSYGVNHKLTVALLIGGVSFGDQDAKITRGVDVLIATPGRLLDHFERGKLLLTGVELLVIDEADRMLDMGFIPDIERICKLVPFTRQTLFFSATMPPEIQRLADTSCTTRCARGRTRRPPPPPTIIAAPRRLGPRAVREARDAAPADPQGDRPQERDHLLQSQARRRASLHRRCSATASRRGALHGDMDQRARMAALEQLPQRRDHAAGRQRRRRARPRHSRRQPCLQFRRAASMPRITFTASAARAAPAARHGLHPRDARATRNRWRPSRS